MILRSVGRIGHKVVVVNYNEGGIPFEFHSTFATASLIMLQPCRPSRLCHDH